MTARQHPEDGALALILDGEEADEETLRHMHDCLDCARRLRAMERRSARLATLLAVDADGIAPPTYDPEFIRLVAPTQEGVRPPWRPTWRPSLRWAAAVALVSLVVGLSPARAWLIRLTGSLLGEAGSMETPVTSERSPTQVLAAVEGPVLSVWIAGDARPDSLVVARSEGPGAGALLRHAGPSGEILVRPGGFEVRASVAGSVLELSLPWAVETVRVVVGGVEVTRRPVGNAPGRAWTIPLR
ncbi:MAG TPA: hypothetical protein VGA70_12335 [Longimicrobiales bacterium]|jgi:hypothetical protein